MNKILIATDFSQASLNAARFGIKLADHLNAGVVLVNAYSLPLAGYDSMAPLNVISEMQTASVDALRDLKRNLLEFLGKDIAIDTVADAGSSMSIITEQVARFKANMVIMGMIGDAGAIKKHLVGSTVVDAIRTLNVPVLVVPEGASFHPFSKVTFAADPHPDEDMTIFFAARHFCELFKAKIEILCVLKPNSDPVSKEFLQNTLEKNLAGEFYRSTFIESTDVGGALEKYIAEHETDLVMLHPKHKGFFGRLFESGLTTRLVYSLSKPILTFHS